MKKKYKVIAMGLAIIAITTCAFAFNQTSLKNIVKTQGIDIKVTSNTDEDKLYSAGATLRYEPIIENRAMSCYIRFKLNLSNKLLSEDSFVGLTEDFVKRGDYFYYTKPLDNKKSITTFNSFKMPADIDNEDKEEIKIIKTVDAIQSKNFTPDFNSENPWGNVEVISSNFDGSNYINEVISIKPINLTINSNKEITLTDKDILNFNLVPGDVITNSIDIGSDNEKEANVDFKAKGEESKLLRNVNLKLYLNDKEIYDGDLVTEKLQDYTKLASLNDGEKASLRYEMSIPDNLDNNYQNQESSFEWKFKINEVNNNIVKTNDMSGFSVVLVIILITSVLGITIFKKER